MQAKRLIIVLFLFLIGLNSFGQTKSPKEFLGYEIGERFTPHHRLLAYMEHVAATNSQVKIQYYGESYEHRPLFVMIVSSESNIQNIENIRQDNLKRTGMLEGTPSTQLPVVWMSYNAHGNETVGVETSLMTLWDLIKPENKKSKEWLNKTVVIIDPCLNPDGHSRYVNWYMQKANKRLTVDGNSVEHFEPWPGGRPNHYLYDLNRDWAWQVQQESQQRIALYNQWMPHMHVDFHEQGVNSPFFMAPAAEPIHAFVANYQKEFQHLIGKNIAQHFDKEAWLYFTREVFDLFYPSYGDTWPTFNGAIGMTFEQAGSGRAGLGILTALGDTLTLYDRVIHHHTAGMASIEIAYQYGEKLVKDFENFFQEGLKNPVGKYKSYVVKASNNPNKLDQLTKLLDKNGIEYAFAKSKGQHKGYSYFSGKEANFSVDVNDLIVRANQPKSVLTQALFEPEPYLTDSMTYDITSWALPYAYGLDSYALENVVNWDVSEERVAETKNNVNAGNGVPLAYVSDWNAAVHAKLLSKLLNEGIRVRYSTRDFSVSGHEFKAGALIIGREGNEKFSDFAAKVQAIAQEFGVELKPVYSGFVDTGSDFGSSDVKAIKAPKIAVVGGSSVSSLGLGEIWHYLEQDLDYGFTMLEASQLGSLNLSTYNVIIMPSGSYGSLGETGFQNLNSWIASGGKIIAIESAVGSFVGKAGFGISRYFSDEEKRNLDKISEQINKDQHLIPFTERERARIANSISGAIFEVKVDETHPLGYGTGGRYFTLKNSSSRYAYLKNGVNVGTIPSYSYHRSGFVGNNLKGMIPQTLVFGVENRGRGQVVYFVDNPMFRGFWENGKLIFNNALFMVGQ